MAYWRDIHRSEPVIITPPAVEPLSLVEAKHHLKINPSNTASDAWIIRNIRTARQQVERDLDQTLPRTTVEMTFDAFPCESFIPVPRAPLVSVESLKSIDDEGVETAMSSANYIVDAHSRPGRILLAPGAAWPTDIRSSQAGKLRWIAGCSGVAKAIASITRSGSTATITTTAAHGLSSAQRITLAGIDQVEYNGTFDITVTGAASFTVSVTGTPATPATGVMTATDLGIKDTHVAAIALLLGHLFVNREPVNVGNIIAKYPLGYESLIGDRMVALA